MKKPQTYANHTRWFPLFHFVITPILVVHLIYQTIRLLQEWTLDRADSVMIAVTLILIGIAARIQALKAQNRAIRLEEGLRYKEILPKDLYERSENLSMGQMIALRFASDAELENLMQRVLDGDLTEAK